MTGCDRANAAKLAVVMYAAAIRPVFLAYNIYVVQRYSYSVFALGFYQQQRCLS